MIRYAAEHYEPRYSPAKDPQFLLDLPHAACRPRSAPDMRSRMRSPSRAPSFCFVKPVWLPRNPTRRPNKESTIRLHATRSERGTDLRGRVSDPPPPRVPRAGTRALRSRVCAGLSPHPPAHASPSRRPARPAALLVLQRMDLGSPHVEHSHYVFEGSRT